MLRPSPNHGTQRLPNDDDDDISYMQKWESYYFKDISIPSKVCPGDSSSRIPTQGSSRKMRVLAHFTIHMVEIIQLYTDQPHTWLGFRYHPSSSVFQPYVWLGTISNSWNNTK